MTPKLKKKWLSDLQSGDYPKTKFSLKDEKGYCCLGVLLESAGVGFEKDVYNAWTCKNPKLGHKAFLSKTALKKFGLKNEAVRELVTINDAEESFDLIIEYIEENV
jgi:hypothetical protein